MGIHRLAGFLSLAPLARRIKRSLTHKPHHGPGYRNCSVYARCRSDDLNSGWQSFKDSLDRAKDDPVLLEMLTNVELMRQSEGTEPFVPRTGDGQPSRKERKQDDGL